MKIDGLNHYLPREEAIFQETTIPTVTIQATGNQVHSDLARVAIESVGASLVARLKYQASLRLGLFMRKHFPDSHPACNRIDDNIILGSLPLKKSFEKIIADYNVTSRLALVDDFEMEASWVAVPLTLDGGKILKLRQKHIPTPDFKPVSLAKIDEGVEWLISEVAEGQTVYVHCKAGKGSEAGG